jgi:hypothetical protein
MTQTILNDRDRIFQCFQEILTQKQQREYQVATKEEEAEKEKNKQLLEVANTYTIDNIVRGLADLQLDFGNIINSLSDRLDTEAGKLDELQRAIAIETQNLQQLQKVRIVADALHLLRQEHQEKLRAIDREISSQQEALEKEMVQTRQTWQQEQQEFETKIQEAQELRQKQRQQEEADYDYELERQRKIETDNYDREKRSIEKDIADRSQRKEKNWTEREQFLAENQALFEENRTKVDGFEEELKQAYIQAKEEAIQEVTREEKVKADLFDKEWEGIQQGYELKITSLETTIQGQNEQIREISAQLQEATKQAQDLAQLAFYNPVNSGDRTKEKRTPFG